MDEYINAMYNEALKGFKNENEILYNDFIAYRRILLRILDLPQRAIPGNKNDMFVSVSSINAIVKAELKKLNATNEAFMKDKKRTKMALKKAWKSFENILPQLLTVMIIIGFALAVLSPQTISKVIGSESGMFGVIVAALIGSITLIPGFVAFPLAAALLENGAGYMQITAFVSTLMMVGVITIPMETNVLGKKLTMTRNIAAFVFSIVAALVMGVIL